MLLHQRAFYGIKLIGVLGINTESASKSNFMPLIFLPRVKVYL